MTDGTNLTYGVDVDIGAASGPLKNVPLAVNNKDLIYAETGAAVTLRRSASGIYEVIGLAKSQPGTYNRVPVCLDDLTIGAIEDVSWTGRVLTYGEIETYGGYGVVPYGASAIFKGGVLQEIKA